MFVNYTLIGILVFGAIFFFAYIFVKKDNTMLPKNERDKKMYTVDQMTKFIKARLDEITRTNLYDIGLSEEELKRRKSKKIRIEKSFKRLYIWRC